MTKSDIKVGSYIISPMGYKWKVVKYYSPDMWLIKPTKLFILTRGQLRSWKNSKERRG